jgi:hypothetical protein
MFVFVEMLLIPVPPSYARLGGDKSHITQLTRSEAKNKTSMLKETWDERHIFGKK